MRRRATVAPWLALLVLLTLGAWIALLRLDTMAMDAAAFFVGWTVMMVAMMLPSVTPLVLLYRGRGRGRLIVGYLVVWVALGVPVYALSRVVDLMDVPLVVVAGVLAAAGVYQFTPLKNACLRACRSPLDFLAVRWGKSPLRLGIHHGVYCAGCCWGLMAVLVVAASMSLTAAALIAAVVFAEKVLPLGRHTAFATGLVLVACSIFVLV